MKNNEKKIKKKKEEKEPEDYQAMAATPEHGNGVATIEPLTT